MKKLITSFRYAFNGLFRNLRTERNLKIHIVAFLLVLSFAIYFSITKLEWIILLLTSALVISLELINSALEKLCDFNEPRQNDKIKIIKDTAAAAVLVAAAFALIIGYIIFLPYFFTQLKVSW